MKTAFTLLVALLLAFDTTRATEPSPYFTASPIELLAFEGRGIDNGVMLFWETSVEWQADAFIVERSADGTDWDPIGTLEAGGNNVGARRYVFLDETPFAGMNFYRLVQRDYLGDARVSDYVDIEYFGDYDPVVFPNPVAPGNPLYVNFFGFENQELQVEVIDQMGRRVDRRSFDLTEGQNRVDMPLDGTSRGLYYVRLFVDDYPVTTYRVVVSG